MKKKQMLAFVSNMENTNELCRNRTFGSEQQIYEILVQCQEMAICLGDSLEERGEKGETLMHTMEQYCECVYQLSQCLADDNSCKKITKEIDSLLITVKNGIAYEMPDDKKEVVFFPYKASMWDSLESVWKETVKNGNWDVYVVPIPYYDKNPDGSVKQWHYEGNEYPEYVPIRSWETYKLEEHYPDRIYIHNPYDNYNYVTSVHPGYYSSELKKYTDELIYIPYFVTLGRVPEHFVILPAVMNADKVIVQSQEVKDSYVRVFEEFVGERQKKLEEQTGKHNEEYWKRLHEIADKKFLALGSPKFQKVRETNRENIVIPDEWEKKIINDDGTKKKVLLYNTTIDALLKHKETYISKLLSVLKFMKIQKDIVLLWRPHPLLQSTIDAMVPQLSTVYQNVVSQYRQADWGIYDDSADLHRAIAISDAYYGDWSSVVALYRETGKPIMIQDTELNL